MPIIPALAGQSPEPAAPGDLADLIAALSDDDVAALEQAAADMAAAPADGDEEAPPSSKSGAAEPDGDEAPDGSEPEDDDEEDEEPADPTPFIDGCEAAMKEATDASDSLADLIEEASEHEKAGIDIDALEKLGDIAASAVEDANDAYEDAESAGDDEDAAGAQAAMQKAQAAAAAATKALADAKTAIGQNADDVMDENAPPDHVVQMNAWAKGVTGGGGMTDD